MSHAVIQSYQTLLTEFEGRWVSEEETIEFLSEMESWIDWKDGKWIN